MAENKNPDIDWVEERVRPRVQSDEANTESLRKKEETTTKAQSEDASQAEATGGAGGWRTTSSIGSAAKEER